MAKRKVSKKRSSTATLIGFKKLWTQLLGVTTLAEAESATEGFYQSFLLYFVLGENQYAGATLKNVSAGNLGPGKATVKAKLGELGFTGSWYSNVLDHGPLFNPSGSANALTAFQMLQGTDILDDDYGTPDCFAAALRALQNAEKDLAFKLFTEIQLLRGLGAIKL